MKGRGSLFSLALVLFSLSAALLSVASSKIADFLCRRVSDPLRGAIAALFATFPIPVCEVAFLSLFVLLPLLLRSLFRAASDGVRWRKLSRRAFRFASVLLSLFLLLSVVPARRTPLPAGEATPDADDFAAFAAALADGITALDRFLPTDKPVSPSPASLAAALSATGLCPIRPRGAKKSLLPGVLSKIGLLGYHFALTGEAIVDPSAPAYTVPFTAAHETAHASGILREDQASYLAYLALAASPDPSLRYAGLMGALDAVLPHLSPADLSALVFKLPARVKTDLALFDQRLSETGGAARIVGGINGTGIALRGGGSYDGFPDLACRRFLTDRRLPAYPE